MVTAPLPLAAAVLSPAALMLRRTAQEGVLTTYQRAGAERGVHLVSR